MAHRLERLGFTAPTGRSSSLDGLSQLIGWREVGIEDCRADTSHCHIRQCFIGTAANYARSVSVPRRAQERHRP